MLAVHQASPAIGMEEDQRVRQLEATVKQLSAELDEAHAKLGRRARLPPVNTDIDFDNIGFGIVRTHAHCKYSFKEGKWNDGEMVAEPIIDLHIHAAVIHYGE